MSADTAARFELDGGTVVLLEASHAIPLVSIVVSLRTGAVHDPAGREGLMRLATRMLRRGSEGLTASQIEDAIDTLGAEMAVDCSASTVGVHAQVIGRNVDEFVDLMARLLAAPTFPEDELERLKRESIAEVIEARDSDRVVAQKALQRTLFPGHPYGRNAGGTTTSIAGLTAAHARELYAKHFVRGNIVIGFSGDVTAPRAKELGERLVARLPHGAAIPDSTPAPTIEAGRRLVFVDKPERTQTQILIATLGTWPRDPDHTALSVANAVFGGTFTSRLMREVRSKRGWSYGAYSRLSIDRQRQSFSLWTFPGAADAAACIALELELLASFVKDGVTDDETGFIKDYLVNSHAFEIDTAAKRLHQSLDVELLGLPADYHTGYLERVQKVDAKSANEAVRARIRENDLLTVVVGTHEEIGAQVAAAIPGLGKTEIVPFDAE